jgi:hypothetical protein
VGAALGATRMNSLRMIRTGWTTGRETSPRSRTEQGRTPARESTDQVADRQGPPGPEVGVPRGGMGTPGGRAASCGLADSVAHDEGADEFASGTGLGCLGAERLQVDGRFDGQPSGRTGGGRVGTFPSWGSGCRMRCRCAAGVWDVSHAVGRPPGVPAERATPAAGRMDHYSLWRVPSCIACRHVIGDRASRHVWKPTGPASRSTRAAHARTIHPRLAESAQEPCSILWYGHGQSCVAL